MKEQFIFFYKNTKIYKKIKKFILKLQKKDKLILSPSALFLFQHKGGIFNRYDLIVRFLAIESLLKNDLQGMNLYKKMQSARIDYLKEKGIKIKNEDLLENKSDTLASLVESFKTKGYDMKSSIIVDSDFQLIDGSHRLACALYFKTGKIVVEKSNSNKISYDLAWFEKYFEAAEIEVIKNKYLELLKTIDLQNVLIDVLRSENQTFGRGDFYQSLDNVNINGQRPTSERFKIYNLEKHLRSDFELLDIGSNCGFLTIKMSDYVRNATGIEIGESLVHVGRLAQAYLQKTNVEFVNANFNDLKLDKKFDFICSFAVHYWLGADIEQYALKLKALLKPEGMVLFESQDIDRVDSDWDDKLKKFMSKGFTEIESGFLKDDGKIDRRFSILKKI